MSRRAELAPLCGVNLHASDGRCDLKGVLEVHTEIGAACFGCCETGDGGEMRERGGHEKSGAQRGAAVRGKDACVLTLGRINGCLAVSNHCVFPSVVRLVSGV
jgi:hypothetical protein